MLLHRVNSRTPSQGSVLQLEIEQCVTAAEPELESYTDGSVRWCGHISLLLESPSWAVPAPWGFSPAPPWSYCRILSVSLGSSSGTVTLLHISWCVASCTGTTQTWSQLCSQLELSVKEMESEVQTVHHKGTGRTGECISKHKGGWTTSFQSSEESEKLKVICWEVTLASNWRESSSEKPFALAPGAEEGMPTGAKSHC